MLIDYIGIIYIFKIFLIYIENNLDFILKILNLFNWYKNLKNVILNTISLIKKNIIKKNK